MRILIVGAGVAGLTVTALLQRQGHSLFLIDQRSPEADLGYAIGLWPQGSRVLHALDIHDAFVAESEPMLRYSLRDNRNHLNRAYRHAASGIAWNMPTHVEWLQHKLLSLIPLILALYAFHRPAIGHGDWGIYTTGGLAVVGAFGLLSHQHLDHPGLNVVNIQHRFFAATCLLIAFSLLQEARGRWVGNSKKLIFPTLLILLSLQLVWYTE